MSNQLRDRIKSLDIFSDESCSEARPMSEEINPYKLMMDLNWMLANSPAAGTCGAGAAYAQANTEMLKVQLYADQDEPNCAAYSWASRQPGLIVLDGKDGECLPFVSNWATLRADGDKALEEGASWNDNAEMKRK